MNEIWTEFKDDCNAKTARVNAKMARLNGVKTRPKAKPEAKVQNFRVRNNVGVRSEFFQREGAALGPSIFVENVDQMVDPQSRHFTWEKAGSTSERSTALEQPPGSTAHGRTQSKYKNKQLQRLNIAHGQSQNTHVNDSMPISPFQNFISDPTADMLPDSEDHYLESAETTPTRGALDFNKSFECRVDIDVPLSAKSEYCMDFYETDSNEILCPKSENCGTILDKAGSCFESENLNESLRNSSSCVLNAKSEHLSEVNPHKSISNGDSCAKSDNLGPSSQGTFLNTRSGHRRTYSYAGSNEISRTMEGIMNELNESGKILDVLSQKFPGPNAGNAVSGEVLNDKSGSYSGINPCNEDSGVVLQAKSGNSAVNSQNVFSSSKSGCCGRISSNAISSEVSCADNGSPCNDVSDDLLNANSGINSYDAVSSEILRTRSDDLEVNLQKAISSAKSEKKTINSDTIQFEGTFYYPGDSEKPCQAPAPPPVAAGNCVLGSGIENKLSELIRVQAQAMQQQPQAMRQQQEIYRESVEVNREQTNIFRKQSELQEQEMHLT